ncbi:DUF3558 family protein [Amycolatopsis sp. K13G38]|uniref:DUF3558 family protein n=1 Tax=Amycolatopsis acididurans TaxID=2724524 RepID=A0ABX1J5A6_9PSEU|nr:DUF3558 family protein [Amycolatopsis acididurans]
MLTAVAVLAAAGVVTGCTTKIAGTPQPGRVTVAPAASTDACSLMTADEAAGLGFATGVPEAAKPESRVPPGCLWKSSDPQASQDDAVEVFYSTDLAIGEYFSTQPTGEEPIGGVTWQNYPSAIGDSFCNLALPLSATSFIAISGSNFTDPGKACDVVRKVAPVIATHVPR